MAKVVAITTADNPYDPIDDWDNWYAYDQLMGYGTCEYLARVAKTSSNLPVPAYLQAIEDGIDDIIASNPETVLDSNGNEVKKYVKVEKI